MTVLDRILPVIPGVTTGNMFGCPAYYVRDKLFACVYENGAGIKVPKKQPKISQGCPVSHIFNRLEDQK